LHSCPECLYEVNRDIASAQELCNRGIETYPGTLEKQEIGSQEGLRGECIRPFKRPVVVLSGNLVLDKWRFRRVETPNSFRLVPHPPVGEQCPIVSLGSSPPSRGREMSLLFTQMRSLSLLLRSRDSDRILELMIIK
jgi:hypothetical protein